MLIIFDDLSELCFNDVKMVSERWIDKLGMSDYFSPHLGEH
jgi:hypothetical protein